MHAMTTPQRRTVDAHIERLRSILTEALRSRDSQLLSIDSDALVGHIAADALVAPTALPHFDNSQMDGYAVRSQDTDPDEHGTATMPLSAVVPAGTAAPELAVGTTGAVMTGSPIPAGADVVIPVEKSADGFAGLDAVRAGEDAHVRFVGLSPEDVRPGRYIRPTGSDISIGDTLVEEGELLTPSRLGVLAACGFDRIPVLQPIRSLVISTGAEVRAPGDDLGPGELYDANSVLIRATLESFGHCVTTVRVRSDDPTDFLQRLDASLGERRPQLVVTAGGVSAGAFEVVRQALQRHEVHFAPIAQQPGGPQGWGALPIPGHNVPAAFIGLPGNPVSCAVSLETLLRPALSALDPACPPPRWETVRLGDSMTSPGGVRQFRRVQLSDGDGQMRIVHPVGGAGSHLLGHLARAQALLVLDEEDQEVSSGAVRRAILLPGASAPPGQQPPHDDDGRRYTT